MIPSHVSSQPSSEPIARHAAKPSMYGCDAQQAKSAFSKNSDVHCHLFFLNGCTRDQPHYGAGHLSIARCSLQKSLLFSVWSFSLWLHCTARYGTVCTGWVSQTSPQRQRQYSPFHGSLEETCALPYCNSTVRIAAPTDRLLHCCTTVQAASRSQWTVSRTAVPQQCRPHHCSHGQTPVPRTAAVQARIHAGQCIRGLTGLGPCPGGMQCAAGSALQDEQREGQAAWLA